LASLSLVSILGNAGQRVTQVCFPSRIDPAIKPV
jgi:hypothetical protein